MSPNRFNIAGGRAFALIQISNIFFVFSYTPIRTEPTVRLVSDVTIYQGSIKRERLGQWCTSRDLRWCVVHPLVGTMVVQSARYDDRDTARGGRTDDAAGHGQIWHVDLRTNVGDTATVGKL
jgi:hypothetical protein